MPAPVGMADELHDVVARRLAALGEPTRLRLVMELQKRDSAAVHELAEAVGGSLPNVSKHLQTLRQAGIVVRRKEGTFVRYSLSNRRVAALVQYSVHILGGIRRQR